MTDTQALAALLARVENGTGEDREMDDAIRTIFGHYYLPLSCFATDDVVRVGGELVQASKPPAPTSGSAYHLARYTSSLDAVMTLVERVLPQAIPGMRRHNLDEGDGWYVWLNSPDYALHFDENATCTQTGSRVTADAASPARALLAALIKAKMEEIAQ